MVPETIGAGSVTTGAPIGASPLPPKLAHAARVEKAAAIIAPFSSLAHMLLLLRSYIDLTEINGGGFRFG